MRHIHRLTAAAGARCVPHGFSTGVLLAATAHFLASISDGGLVQCSQSTSPLATTLVTNRLPLVQPRGHLPPLDGPHQTRGVVRKWVHCMPPGRFSGSQIRMRAWSARSRFWAGAYTRTPT